MSNIDELNKHKFGNKMTKKDVELFLRACRKKLFDDETGTVFYDALFVTIGAHGIHNGIVCSDGKLYKHHDIRSLFENDTNLRKIPKIYLVDACREFIEEKDSSNSGLDSIRGNPKTNSITLFGTSNGNTVKGA
eukprot:547578_1